MTTAVGGATGASGAGCVQQPDLQTLMMSVLSTRSEMLDAQVRTQADAIKQNNAKLQEMNKMLSDARTQAGAATDDKCTTMSTGLKAQFDKYGVPTDRTGNDNIHNKTEWQTNIENLKTAIDSLTSTSQMDMTQLQATMNKYNQTFEMMSNFIAKYSDSLKSVTGNIR